MYNNVYTTLRVYNTYNAQFVIVEYIMSYILRKLFPWGCDDGRVGEKR